MKNILLLLFTIALFTNCQKVAEYYIGLPLQPTNINSIYEPGLNVFGMIKAGPTYDSINQYVEVQNILHVFTLADTFDILSVQEAKITLVQKRNNAIVNEYLLDTINWKYYHPAIEAVPGDVWEYECIYDTFRITSASIIPNLPQMVDGSLSNENGMIRFQVEPDSTAFMYDAYFISDKGFALQRIVPNPNQSINVELSIGENWGEHMNQIFVYAYDSKYQQYVTTSNIFFKPNAFRPRFTTVEGGYGCFGTASSLMVELE
jgi:hypothetical protein